MPAAPDSLPTAAQAERRRVAEVNGRVREHLARRGVRSERDAWVMGEVTRGEERIPPVVSVPVPPHFRKTCPGASLSRLHQLLPEVDTWARQLEGLEVVEAAALYNGDPLAMVLRDEICAWGLEYARARLERPSPKDLGDPFRRWLRLQQEVVSWLEVVCLRLGVATALADVPDRVAHAIWAETVGRELTVTRTDEGMWLSFGHVDARWFDAVRRTMELYSWNEADALARARSRFVLQAPGAVPELLRRRSALAEDLVEARALLIGADDPIAPVALSGGHLTFWWALQHSAGILLSASDRAMLDEQLATGFLHGPLRIHLDGRVSGHVTWWEEGAAPGWEVALLEAVHAPLVEAWLARVPAPAPTEEPVTTEAAVAVVADANRRIAEPVEGRTLPAVRMETLLGLLERRFQCEVSAAKGSEVTVYRPGGRKFTLGRHARNRHVPAHLVRALLKAVGISVTEWWATLDR